MYSSFVIATLLSVACAVHAVQNFTIQVGPNSTLTYSPNNITGAQVGDILNFVFHAKNHTVTQSTFADPCSPMSGGFDSGFNFPVSVNATDFPTLSLTIKNASVPTWLYCRQANPSSHCHAGMVMGVNAPSTGNTFAKFLAAAEALGNSTSTSAGSSASPTSAGSSPYGTSAGTAATGTPAGSVASGTTTGSAASTSATNAGKKFGSSYSSLAVAVAVIVGLTQ